ncbi:MAG: DUF5668 domain-containing protein [bacterium]
MKKDDHMCGGGIFCGLDFFDKLLVVFVGVILLLVNVGLLSVAWLAYWPLILIIIGLKGFLGER